MSGIVVYTHFFFFLFYLGPTPLELLSSPLSLNAHNKITNNFHLDKANDHLFVFLLIHQQHLAQ